MSRDKLLNCVKTCISILLCRQQEEETQHPVEEWVEGAVVPQSKPDCDSLYFV